jgi:hypothetical protein
MVASPATCRVSFAQLRGLTQPTPLLVRLEACAHRKRGLECPSVGIQTPSPRPSFGEYLTKPIRLATSLPVQFLYSLGNEVDASAIVRDGYVIGHWSFVPRDCRRCRSRLYNAFEQLFEGGLLN